MNQLYDETLVLVGFGIEGVKNKEIPQEIENYQLFENLNPRLNEEIITIANAKSKVLSATYLNYNIFRTY
ncbi:MAG: hypothetical protein ACW98X_16985 [Promethearchaeota archaeon]|jgi:hypothetical protein